MVTWEPQQEITNPISGPTRTKEGLSVKSSLLVRPPSTPAFLFLGFYHRHEFLSRFDLSPLRLIQTSPPPSSHLRSTSPPLLHQSFSKQAPRTEEGQTLSCAGWAQSWSDHESQAATRYPVPAQGSQHCTAHRYRRRTSSETDSHWWSCHSCFCAYPGEVSWFT